MKMANEQHAGESEHGQFNIEQGRQEPSGEDTALMTDGNTGKQKRKQQLLEFHHQRQSVCPALGNMFRPALAKK